MKRIVFKIFTLALLFTIGTMTINAYNPLAGGKLSRGVGNVCYTVNGGARNYITYINQAANNWVYTGWDNPIYMTAVSSNYGTAIDIYSRADGNNGIYAYTIYFNSSGIQQTYTKNYYTEIWLNSSTIAKGNIGGIIRHEMGHAFGMAENNGNPYSIMAQSWARKVQTVQKVDNDTINYLY